MSDLAERPKTRLAIVGTDLKFIRPLIDRFETSGWFEVRVDEWPKFRVHDEAATREVMQWAQTVVCEWAGPNAVVASRLKRPGQRLVVRLHRMELNHPEWQEIDIDAVDLVVTVGPHYRRQVLDTTGWPTHKVIVVPNHVDEARLNQAKSPDAIHHLGMIGFSSSRKRLDLALEVLVELRRADPRYHLFLKGSSPWGLKWVEDRPEEVEFFQMVRERLHTEELLADAVTLDPQGPDIGSWLRKIGFLLSTSDDESFHLSPAEGMASGAVPVIRPWPGAEDIYDPHWIAEDPAEMADRIASLGEDRTRWMSEGRRAQTEALSRYRLDQAVERWISHVLRPRDTQRPEGAKRVSIVSSRNATRDPALRALAHSLDAVGHEVVVVSRGKPEPGLPPRALIRPDPETEGGYRSIGRFARRLRTRLSGDPPARSLKLELSASKPDLVYPHREDDMTLCDDVEAPVVRRPQWAQPERDLVSMAPHSADLSVSPTTQPGHRLPVWPESSPAPDRHRGKTAVVAYRVTPTSPGRYIEAAMRRAGMAVVVMDGEIDWESVPSDAAFVLVVESPYPPLDVRGHKRPVPTFLWVHHGEHHLPANSRLTCRYQADAVLLAHSWHLAHRFPVPTHRFPFAMAPELSASSAEPWQERAHDVAMVGAGIGGSGGRYDRRRDLIDLLENASDIRTEFAYGLSPKDMVGLYGDTRIVINEGGPRHFPITMRVFEATGAGALLLTEDQPGTDTLLQRHTHYVPMQTDVVTQARHLLADAESPSIAETARAWVSARHTYDHRVDRLLSLASMTQPKTKVEDPFPPLTPIAALIGEDVEVQHLATFGDVDPLGLDDRAVRVGDASQLAERSIDAVILGRGVIPDLRQAVLAARGYVYADHRHAEAVTRVLSEERPEASISRRFGLLRADLGGTPYRMRSPDHPLAS